MKRLTVLAKAVVCAAGAVLVGGMAHAQVGPVTYDPLRWLTQGPAAEFLASQSELWFVIGGGTSGENTYFRKQERTLRWREWNESLSVRLSWSTAYAGAVSAVYQVTTVPFPTDPALSLTPAGLVAVGDAGAVPAAGGKTYFAIDFRVFAPVPPGESRPTAGGVAKAPAITPAAKIGTTRLPLTGTAPQLSTVPTPQAVTLLRYYIRVVTLDALGRPTGIPSAPLTVLYGDAPPEPETSSTTWQGQRTAVHPVLRVLSYEPIQDQDPEAVYYFVVTRDTEWGPFRVKKGDTISLKPYRDEKSFWEQLSDAIHEAFSSIEGFAKSATNWVARAYEDIKRKAVDLAVVVAGENARGLITAGLEIGLAAMGIPPSIPNFDELSALGRDYLIKTVADYAGVPPQVAATAVNEFLEAARQQASSGGNPYGWLRPDPGKYYRPAYLSLVAVNSAPTRSDPVYASVKITVPNGTSSAELFLTATAFVPALGPDEFVTLQVYLQENTAFPPPAGYALGGESPYAGMQRFRQAYCTLSATLLSGTTAGADTANPWQSQDSLTIDDCRYRKVFRSFLPIFH